MLALSDLLLVVLVLDGVGGGMSVIVVGIGLGVLVGWPVCCPLVAIHPFVIVPDGVGISNGVGGSIFIVFVCIVLALVSMHLLVGLFIIMLFDSCHCVMKSVLLLFSRNIWLCEKVKVKRYKHKQTARYKAMPSLQSPPCMLSACTS